MKTKSATVLFLLLSVLLTSASQTVNITVIGPGNQTNRLRAGPGGEFDAGVVTNVPIASIVGDINSLSATNATGTGTATKTNDSRVLFFSNIQPNAPGTLNINIGSGTLSGSSVNVGNVIASALLGNLTGNVIGNASTATLATNSINSSFSSNAAAGGTLANIVDPVVGQYALTTMTNPPTSVLQDLNGFVSDMRRQGLYSYWVDTVVLKTNYGASASQVVSLAGRTTTVSGLAFSQWGSTWSSSSPGSIKLPLTGFDLRTNTIFITFRKNGPGYVYPGSARGSMAGLWTDSNNGYWIDNNGVASLDVRTNGTDIGGQGIEYYYFTLNNGQNSTQWRLVYTFAISQAGTNVSFYIDGQPASVGAGGVSSTIAANLFLSSPVTNLWIGAAPDGTLPLDSCEIDQVTVFSTNLNNHQVLDVQRAVRWFESSDIDLCFIGDSTGCPDGNAAGVITNYWPQILVGLNNWGNYGPRIYLNCVSGQTLQSFAPGGVNIGSVTNQLYLSKPVGKVKRSIFLNTIGVNDVTTGISSAAYATAAQALFAMEMTNGSEAWAMTIPTTGTNGQWNATQELVRQTNNAWLRSHEQFYTALFDKDALFPANLFNDTNTWTYEGIHCRYQGNLLQAEQLVYQIKGLPLLAWSTWDSNGVPKVYYNSDGATPWPLATNNLPIIPNGATYRRTNGIGLYGEPGWYLGQ